MRTPIFDISRKPGKVSNAYHTAAPSEQPLGLNPPPLINMAKLRMKTREIKDAKGMSIQDLVMASGLSRTAVLDILNGRGRIEVGRIDTWWAIAWALGVRFSTLMNALDEADES